MEIELPPRCASLLLVTLAAVPMLFSGAEAGALTRLWQQAAEVGGGFRTGKADALEQVARHLASAPPEQAALAATVSPEGHWTFLNRAGERLTAANRDELQRVPAILLPGLAADGRIVLYLAQDAVFTAPAELARLPLAADLRIVAGAEAYALRRMPGAAPDGFAAEVRPNLLVDAAERALFAEALWQLARPLAGPGFRLVALDPASRQALPWAPRIDAQSGRAVTDAVAPGGLAGAMRGIAGQSLALAGRIDGRLLYFRPASGPEQSIVLDGLLAAAAEADVNLLVLHSHSPRQPGGRNWLWQRVEVAGLDAAADRATLADVLAGLAAEGRFRVTAADGGGGRVRMSAVAVASHGAPVPPAGMLTGLVSELTGRIVVSAVEADLASAARVRELEARIVPRIPSAVQFGYLALLIAGLVGLPAAAAWWRRLWPAEQRASYAGGLGYHAARLVRLVAFLALFLPLAGLPALLWMLAAGAFRLAGLPVRLLRGIAGSGTSRAA